MLDRQEINAGAAPNLILVTYGLMNFTKSDDEIAMVLGHELAHITKGHISKITGIQILTGLAAIGLGILSDQLSPGSGVDVIRAASGISEIFGRSYSRDLEREADYFGLRYVKLAGYDYKVASEVWERFANEVPKSMVQSFLNTHPSSPERMVRIQKIIRELEN
jgi:predicted Zn-dependent protease